MRASFSSSTFTPDRLVVSLDDVVSEKVTLLSGENRSRGAVLGKITLGAASRAAKAGNTGNGAMTLDAETPILAGAQVGVYKVVCIAAAGNGGTFRVTDPKGNVLGDVAVAATFANQIKFSIADGDADFIVGDEIDVTIAAGSGKYKLATAAAVDGSAVPDAILAEDADGTNGDVPALVYTRGQFNDTAVTLGAGLTVATIKEGLRQKGIDLITVQAA